MINKFKRKLDEIKLALAIGLSKADKDIMNGNFTKAPESAGIINPAYSRNSFLRNTQLGQLKQEEVERFNEMLASFDYIHGKVRYEFFDAEVEVVDEKTGKKSTIIEKVGIAIPLTPEEIMEAENAKQKIGDFEEGYRTEVFISNDNYLYQTVGNYHYEIENDETVTEVEKIQYKAEGKITRPRLVVKRDGFSFSNGMKIENFTKEVLIKKSEEPGAESSNDVLIEFYCVNYNIKQLEFENKMGFIPEDDEEYKADVVYNKVMEGLNLKPFIDFIGISIVKNSATSNYKTEDYEIKDFRCIKKYKNGFVVKFNGKLI